MTSPPYKERYRLVLFIRIVSFIYPLSPPLYSFYSETTEQICPQHPDRHLKKEREREKTPHEWKRSALSQCFDCNKYHIHSAHTKGTGFSLHFTFLFICSFSSGKPYNTSDSPYTTPNLASRLETPQYRRFTKKVISSVSTVSYSENSVRLRV